MVKKCVLAAKSRQARQAQRRKVGTLKSTTVAPKTQARYSEALRKFFVWLSCLRMAFPSKWERLDEVVCSWIEHLWHEGEPKSWAGDTLSGLQHESPLLRGRLRLGWRLHKAWGMAEMPSRAPPITLGILQAICGLAACSGDWDLAIMLFVGFECLLRTGEMLALRKQDFLLNVPKGTAVVNLGMTKGAKRSGAEESVTIADRKVVEAVAAYVQGLCEGDFIFKRSPAIFRKKFALLCRALGLEDLAFRPYSIRRGGATHHFRSGASISSTTVRGRWGNSKTARIYINEGLAMLADISISESSSVVQYYAKQWQTFTSEGKAPVPLPPPRRF